MGWTERRYHLGNNKEVFGAEVYAIYQALCLFDARSESNNAYPVFSDLAQTDRAGPG